MESNGIAKMPKALEIRVESEQEISRSVDQIHDSDSLRQVNKGPLGVSRGTADEGDRILEGNSIAINLLSNADVIGSKFQSMTSSSLDSKPIYEQSDLCSTPDAPNRVAHLLQSSPAVEVSPPKDLSYSAPPLGQKG